METAQPPDSFSYLLLNYKPEKKPAKPKEKLVVDKFNQQTVDNFKKDLMDMMMQQDFNGQKVAGAPPPQLFHHAQTTIGVSEGRRQRRTPMHSQGMNDGADLSSKGDGSRMGTEEAENLRTPLKQFSDPRIQSKEKVYVEKPRKVIKEGYVDSDDDSEYGPEDSSDEDFERAQNARFHQHTHYKQQRHDFETNMTN